MLRNRAIPTLFSSVSGGSFNGHPPLGVNATLGFDAAGIPTLAGVTFQWAPTLGGECYSINKYGLVRLRLWEFQWAPTLGGECYKMRKLAKQFQQRYRSFNGHPPLGVNATLRSKLPQEHLRMEYVSMGTHPWG